MQASTSKANVTAYNGAKPATRSSFHVTCLDMLPDVDLLFIEYVRAGIYEGDGCEGGSTTYTMFACYWLRVTGRDGSGSWRAPRVAGVLATNYELTNSPIINI